MPQVKRDACFMYYSQTLTDSNCPPPVMLAYLYPPRLEDRLTDRMEDKLGDMLEDILEDMLEDKLKDRPQTHLTL